MDAYRYLWLRDGWPWLWVLRALCLIDALQAGWRYLSISHTYSHARDKKHRILQLLLTRSRPIKVCGKAEFVRFNTLANRFIRNEQHLGAQICGGGDKQSSESEGTTIYRVPMTSLGREDVEDRRTQYVSETAAIERSIAG